ncbi:UDP-4-amino-4,6-dideoxy-N-acetyl-beta-L-altrosamine N-acetyltransferase [Sporosarcina cyprini]|uniref:UDP-4-amino-4, 6-dideoxy-N-acetyl-beta-L-altrosamine N-acetyltransferase n=1 Tax=Sporosarcina cyprini TaxID=2910523 RepID=UPI001EDF790A|nr:UDP-4-amino-4,6-dideoxy-N-acetyl-beta-L-altrosamine N-acetyltransferase [Sporosarcina cyprini]MCG3089604.1 UDP-4-amino-4,6-dideoxy-N-acetyl-beta-L-altrosamine N-acetyltransferase [Sporosarcina cyprini]
MQINHMTLRDIKEEDLKMILSWRNSKIIRESMINNEIISLQEHYNWFNKIKNNPTAITKLFVLDELPVGILNINDYDKKSNTCDWGFYLSPEHHRKGLGKYLGYKGLNYIFEEMNIRKLSAEVLGTNVKSLYFHEKWGFTSEGIKKEQVLRDIYAEDLYLFGYFKEEWEINSKRFFK